MTEELPTIRRTAAAGPDTAQSSGREVTVSLSGWFSGLGSTVETRFGEVDAGLDVADVPERLDMAYGGSGEARTGRWALITDLIFTTDLSSGEDRSLGVAFRSAEVAARRAPVSAYAASSAVGSADPHRDLGAGFRNGDAGIDLDLAGNAASPTSLSFSDSPIDPAIGARLRPDFSQGRFGPAFAEIGGFGLDETSERTWQASAGTGYRINEIRAVQVGHRHLSIRRDLDGRVITPELGGPMLGVQASF